MLFKKNKELTTREKLSARFDEGWGKWISCGSGWDWILDEIDEKLNYIDPKYTIQQVKEKFGTLRFYFEPSNDKLRNSPAWSIMEDIVRAGEQLSAYTCETCGKCSRRAGGKHDVKYDSSAKLRGDSWYVTLCDTCAEKEEK